MPHTHNDFPLNFTEYSCNAFTARDLDLEDSTVQMHKFSPEKQK